ncbi:hypothetical protein RB195_018217 [Necator americanus]|uniref:Signal recognition particle receptor subunit beta n=1 Tax=Necator americanus TaxID=51031 RepID=A0ABR1CAY5_NECAM
MQSSTVVEGMIVSPPSMGTNQRWTVLMAVVPSSNVLLRLRTADVTAALPFMEDNAIIFVVDSSAPERFPEVIRVVEEVVEDSHIDSCQLLLVVNRKATEHTASCPSIASLLGSLPRFGQPIKDLEKLRRKNEEKKELRNEGPSNYPTCSYVFSADKQWFRFILQSAIKFYVTRITSPARGVVDIVVDD